MSTTIPTQTKFPLCALCHAHVPLETCNTNERGRAVHEQCYVSYVTCQKVFFTSASFNRTHPAAGFFKLGRWASALGLRKNKPQEMNSI